ncbi:protein PECTIC ARABINOGALACTAN SYNTHESIS-RELATED [Dendrobium catenatum]|uniref:O-fucosyltransferase family protein n=1 Tax=Dendrobium catenatum TaxID=906689 RepID=A0A2I0XAQ0_9ASPA|nr:protein PECTIC ARABINOGALACTAN SYNTHESIS-RELATED [Dendrobium catenatum]XP_028548761.1 protein PECTIC ARABINOGALACTAN SYNTHESIS-RELATED [Dendrobium catenatum]XP_028548762.1 protein PECTIC ARABINOGALACTAN SYNTHESIS-RELATED [Dendrobium catenatum]XP_028548763.1 protein PECTIC ARABINOGALACTAN SYNTHESIS-RELATED [Dendrobium catenatum]XP_028548764.1 protein PECTIC ARABINOGALACTAN SYNTHESIS-RELATED [Dendrobium catenatum]XP_028548765.1 protein PECTIC ARABINOGALACTAN SYNTHESIS-RELATED [Dendrobium cate
MPELRHSVSMGTRAVSSPVKRDDTVSSLFSGDIAGGSVDDGHRPFARGRDRNRDRDHDRDKEAHRSFLLRLPNFIRSFLSLDDLRAYSLLSSHRVHLAFLAFLLLIGLVSLPYLWTRLNAPYLCIKEGITLHCPKTREPSSLWENPHSSTTSWKPCAERSEKPISDIPPENETNGYIFIHAEGGLNQQRIAICNAVAVAKIMNATLILPVLKQDQIWKDQTKLEDIFDVDHFIEYLKDDVRIVRDIPDWFTDKAELFTSIRRTVKNIPKYAPAHFYIDNVLPRIKEKKIMALKPFVDRLGYDNVPPEINRLRCRVNYHALKFLPEIEEMADLLAVRMRNRTGSPNPYMALHLRFEKGMVGLSFCDFVGTREEKAMMAAYRQKEWPRRYKNGSHLWQLALQKRKEGRCPLEPGEVAVILRAMGYPKETQIYVASGQVYGGQTRMAPLRNMFPNLVTKEELASTDELSGFRKHVTSLAALDFLVCLKSDVFVMTHGGNFAKLIIGARRYMGHRLKSIKPDKGLMSKSFGDPYMGWASFIEDVVITHETRTGLPEETFPNYDLWENPLTPCMCRA